MKGGGTSVAPVYAGVRTDLEKFLEKFLNKSSVRYKHFLECFKEMKLSLIYVGRNTENELREFEEKVLSIALSYCFPPYSFQAQVGGVYLLYSLYNLQPRKCRMKIRATMPMLKCLTDFLDDLRKGSHYDSCFILTTLLRDDAFYICKYPEEHNPLTYRRFDCKEDLERATQTLRSGKSAMDELLDDVLMQQMETLHKQYVLMKATLFHGSDDLPQPLSLITTCVTDYVKSAVKDCDEKLERRFGRSKRRNESTSDGSPHKQKRNVKDRRMEIRERAYAAISEPGRFQRKKKSQKNQEGKDGETEDQ